MQFQCPRDRTKTIELLAEKSLRAAWRAGIPLLVKTFEHTHLDPARLELGVSGITGNQLVDPLSAAEYELLQTIVRKQARKLGIKCETRSPSTLVLF